jgi:hypothetical protein
MDAEHARELLARERSRIERLLADARARGADEDLDRFEASDVAPDLLDAELGEGQAERLTEELAAPSSGPKEGSPKAPTACRWRAESRYPTGAFR